MRSPFLHRSRQLAFTLIEMLVALAVFSIMVLFFSTMVSSVSTVWSSGQQMAENASNARAILDLMSQELQAGVSRPDLYQTNWIAWDGSSSTVRYYSRTVGSTISGVTGTNAEVYRPLSYIGYTWQESATNACLERGDQAVLWTDPSSSSLPLGNPTSVLPPAPAMTNDVLDGVVAFQVSFLQLDGTFTETYSSTNTIAADVSLALVDSKSLQLLIQTGKVMNLSTLLSNAQTAGGNTNSPMMDWQNAVNTSPGLQGYPQQVRTGLRFFERTVDLPKPTL